MTGHGVTESGLFKLLYVLASFPDSTPQLFIALCIKAGRSLVHFVTRHASSCDVGCVVWGVVLLIRLRVTFIDVRRSKPLLHVRFSSTNGRSAKSRRKQRLESCLSFSKSGRTVPTKDKDKASQVSINGD